MIPEICSTWVSTNITQFDSKYYDKRSFVKLRDGYSESRKLILQIIELVIFNRKLGGSCHGYREQLMGA